MPQSKNQQPNPPRNIDREQQRRLYMQRQYRLRRKKAQQRKRIIMTAVLCIVLLTGSLLFIGIHALLSGTIGKLPDVPGTSVDTQEPSEPREPLVTVDAPSSSTYQLYEAPNAVTGAVIQAVEYINDTTLYKVLDQEIDCAYMILMNASTGAVIAKKDADHLIYPASMTKLMTVLVAYENCTDLDATFRMTTDIIDPLYLDGLSLAGFVGGETITIRDMLYGSALPSGAEASMGLAVAVCGSEEAFVQKMNMRAESLGMHDTHFQNCTGQHDDDHVSSLQDIAVLLAFMEQNETLRQLLSTYQYTTTPTVQHPEGLLLTSTVYSRMVGDESVTCEVIGGKTGYTVEAGQCLATYAVRSDTGKEYVCVLADGATKWEPIYDTIKLYQLYTEP